MASKRKYEDVSNYWVYSIKVPSINKYYIGVSKLQCSQRWKKALYKDSSLEPYLNEWQDMIKTVLVDNLNTKKEALIMEDNIIQALKMNNLCINERRSGLIEVSDKNAYQRELLKNNTEYRENQKEYKKQYHKQHYENDVEYREQKKQRVKQWYEDNKEKRRKYMKQYRLKKKLEKQLN